MPIDTSNDAIGRTSASGESPAVARGPLGPRLGWLTGPLRFVRGQFRPPRLSSDEALAFRPLAQRMSRKALGITFGLVGAAVLLLSALSWTSGPEPALGDLCAALWLLFAATVAWRSNRDAAWLLIVAVAGTAICSALHIQSALIQGDLWWKVSLIALPLATTLLVVRGAVRFAVALALPAVWFPTYVLAGQPQPSPLVWLIYGITFATALGLSWSFGQLAYVVVVRQFVDERRLAALGEGLSQRVEQRRELLREAFRRLAIRREEVRSHLADELHDSTGQTLTALKLRLELAEMTTDQLDGCIQLGRISGKLDRLVAGVRHVLERLRPRILSDLGLRPAIEWLTETTRTRFTCDIRVTLQPSLDKLSPERAIAVYRLVEDLMEIAVVRSGAEQLKLIGSRDPSTLTIRLTARVTEAQLDTETASCLRERMLAVGGSARLHSDGEQLTIELTAPWGMDAQQVVS